MLPPRLDMIAKRIHARCMADIGTDHAFLPIRLLEQAQIECAIATDVHAGPLAIAKSHVADAGLDGRIDLRLGDGLAPLQANEADVIVIAGMGGTQICAILDTGRGAIGQALLYLQPMNAQYELRKWLLGHGFDIVGEDIGVEKHRVYNLILARIQPTRLTFHMLDYHLPPYLKTHPCFEALRAKKRREFQKIIAGQRRAKQPDFELLQHYETLLAQLERM